MSGAVEDYPRTQVEFDGRFTTEKACRAYVARLRWPKGFSCPGCDGTKAWPVRTLLWQCAGCGRQTSGWKGYSRVKASGYRHRVSLIRGQHELASEHLPRVHRIASLLKRWLLGTHQGAVSRAHLDYYLDEFTFRFNRRRSQHRGKLFFQLLQQAVAVEPVPYRSLVQSAQGERLDYNRLGLPESIG